MELLSAVDMKISKSSETIEKDEQTVANTSIGASRDPRKEVGQAQNIGGITKNTTVEKDSTKLVAPSWADTPAWHRQKMAKIPSTNGVVRRWRQRWETAEDRDENRKRQGCCPPAHAAEDPDLSEDHEEEPLPKRHKKVWNRACHNCGVFGHQLYFCPSPHMSGDLNSAIFITAGWAFGANGILVLANFVKTCEARTRYYELPWRTGGR